MSDRNDVSEAHLRATSGPETAFRSPQADPWSRRSTPLAFLLLTLLALQGLAFIGESSQTNDEGARIVGGYAYLTRGDFRLDIVQPPLLKELTALPLLLLGLDFPAADSVPAAAGQSHAGAYRLGEPFLYRNRVAGDTILFAARLPTLALSLLLGGLIFVWGRRLFGPRGALLALALYVLDPNVVAHSGLATTDIGAALFFLLTVLAFGAWIRRPTGWSILALGSALGGAFAAKYSSLWLLPILAALGLFQIVSERLQPVRSAAPAVAGGTTQGSSRSSSRVPALILGALGAAAIGFLVLALCYGLRGLPAYFSGLGYGMKRSEGGYTAYLMGDSSPNGWWYYFLFSYLVKTPPGTLLIVGASIFCALTGRRRAVIDEALLWIPIVLIAAITCFWRVNIGLRHLLPLYPFLYVSAGRLAWPAGSGASGPGHPPRPITAPLARFALPALIVLGLGWNLLEAASISPDNLAYFNRFAGGPANGHRYLLDSNLDWGQASKALRRFMTQAGVPIVYCSFAGNSDPWYAGVRYQYLPGLGNFDSARERREIVPDGAPRELLAVSAMSLHFTAADGESLYDWLGKRPVIAMPGYAYLVYDITGDADAHGRLAVLDLANGLGGPAQLEARRALRLDPGDLRARAVLARLGLP